jgi:hypothetical protein
MGFFEVHLLETILPLSPSSLRLEAVLERSCPACYKYLFLPLSVIFSGFFLVVLAGLGSAFHLPAARFTLSHEVFAIFYLLSISL